MPRMPAMFSSFFVAFAFFAAAVHAVPLAVQLAARDSVSPPITSPKAGDVWHVGQTVNVTWDTSGLENVSNSLGSILLGFLENDSENLMINSPLAAQFDIFQGTQAIVVPDVPPRTNYIVALLGDSGNISPEFQIVAKAAPATPSPPISERPTTPASVPPSTPSSPTTSDHTTPSTPPASSAPSTFSGSSTPSSTPTSPIPSAQSSPASTSTVTAPTSNTAAPSPASANTNTSDGVSLKHMKLTSVVLALAAALFMI